MTLIFDSYVASQGKGVLVTENRKNCQLNIDLLYPPGFQYSVFSADYRGYAALDKGVTGTQKSTYYFSGQTAQVSHAVQPNIRDTDQVAKPATRRRRRLISTGR